MCEMGALGSSRFQYFQNFKKVDQKSAMLQEKWSQYFCDLSLGNSSWSTGQNAGGC